MCGIQQLDDIYLLVTQEKTKRVIFGAVRNTGGYVDEGSWITFSRVWLNKGVDFDASTGTFTIPESGIYLFGVRATSGNGKAQTKINAYFDDKVLASINDGKEEGLWNNLSGTFMGTLLQGSKIRLKVERNNISYYVTWWGVRISER